MFGSLECNIYLCTRNQEMIATISRSGAVVARWAHNPKVIRSSRISATKDKKNRRNAVLLFYDDSSLLTLLAQSENLGDCVKILIFAS